MIPDSETVIMLHGDHVVHGRHPSHDARLQRQKSGQFRGSQQHCIGDQL